MYTQKKKGEGGGRVVARARRLGLYVHTKKHIYVHTKKKGEGGGRVVARARRLGLYHEGAAVYTHIRRIYAYTPYIRHIYAVYTDCILKVPMCADLYIYL